jgi:hypothetical protein
VEAVLLALIVHTTGVTVAGATAAVVFHRTATCWLPTLVGGGAAAALGADGVVQASSGGQPERGDDSTERSNGPADPRGPAARDRATGEGRHSRRVGAAAVRSVRSVRPF